MSVEVKTVELRVLKASKRKLNLCLKTASNGKKKLFTQNPVKNSRQKCIGLKSRPLKLGKRLYLYLKLRHSLSLRQGLC